MPTLMIIRFVTKIAGSKKMVKDRTLTVEIFMKAFHVKISGEEIANKADYITQVSHRVQFVMKLI